MSEQKAGLLGHLIAWGLMAVLSIAFWAFVIWAVMTWL